jgi:hypothetical protein
MSRPAKGSDSRGDWPMQYRHHGHAAQRMSRAGGQRWVSGWAVSATAVVSRGIVNLMSGGQGRGRAHRLSHSTKLEPKVRVSPGTLSGEGYCSRHHVWSGPPRSCWKAQQKHGGPPRAKEVRVQVEIMGSQKCKIVGKSQEEVETKTQSSWIDGTPL